ncbi:MAG: hypothetical protein EA358_02935 [Flavobacteriales bacterium]|nr:MAG: hypothetical protein EA358_02935 [Flavobacteriales bacterium]
MRITTLRLKNIHSLRGEHTIDFDKGVLAEAGLFAITGPTGAGKSTLLDAITLALYRSIPRTNRISPEQIKSQGIILTHHTDECYAEVEFVVKSKRYRAHWSIAKTRGGDNFRQPRHELSEVDSGKIICDRYSDTVKEVEKVVGLSYDQFVKAMLLAQGEFSKLLKADTKERDQLLEDITGAHIYRSIGRAVFERYKRDKSALEHKQTQHDLIEVLDAETQKTLEDELESFAKRVDSLDAERKILEEVIGLKRRKLELTKRQKDNQDRFTIWKKDRDAWAVQGERLALHDKLAQFREPMSELRQKELEVERNKKEILEAKEELDRSEQRKRKAEETAVKLLGKNPDNFNEELRDFRDLVLALDEAINLDKTNLENQTKALRRLGDSLAKRLGEFNETQNADFWVAQIRKNQEDLGIYSLENLENARQKIEIREGYLESYSGQLKVSKLLTEKLQDFDDDQKKALDKHLENRKNLEDITKQISEETPIRDNLKIEVDQRRREASLETQRAELQDGEPCPLCGSTDHPYAEHLPELDQTREKLLAEIEKKIKRLEKEEVGLKTRIEDFENNQKTLENRRLDIQREIEKHQEKIAHLNDQLGWKDGVFPLEEESQTLKDRAKTLNTLEIQMGCLGDLDEFLKIAKELPEIKKSFGDKSTKRESLYTGPSVTDEVSNCIQMRDGALEMIERTGKQLKTLGETLAENTDEVSAKSQKLLHQIAAFGLANIDDLSAGILPENEANKLRTAEKELREKQQKIEGERETISAQLSDIDDRDERSLDECEKSQKEAVKHLEDLRNGITRNNTRLEHNREQAKKRAEIMKTIEDDRLALEIWHKLNIMIGDATGAKFSSFVQRLTLKQLLLFANDRLRGLSDRYRLLYTEDSDSLMVEDMHLGSTTRTVSSLSGGETFKLSLALALGLSDLAAQNVKIESLFIDEGFGTLDSDSLNEAIATLENIQSTGNKSVGIISHVEELKERVSAKINVVPTGKGYSRVEIIG